MKRYFIVAGNRTTQGGTVTEGDSLLKIHGKAQAYHGAHVYCPACESYGVIVGDGQTRSLKISGKQAALEGDLCICKCDPPPRLIASMHKASMSFEMRADASVGNASGDGPLFCDRDMQFDQHFRFVDQDGRPVAGIRVHLTGTDGELTAVTTDAQGRTPLKYGRAGQRIGVTLRGARR
jgi:YD repeat-containing protein